MALVLQAAIPLFHVFDVPTSLRFYRDLLGFELVHHATPFTNAPDDFGWALLRHGTVELMLNNAYEDNQRPPEPDPARTRAHADTILYCSAPDVDAAYAYLQLRGVPTREPAISFYGMKQLYLADPDNYTLCLQHPAAP